MLNAATSATPITVKIEPTAMNAMEIPLALLERIRGGSHHCRDAHATTRHLPLLQGLLFICDSALTSAIRCFDKELAV